MTHSLAFGLPEASLPQGGVEKLLVFLRAMKQELGRTVEPLITPDYDSLEQAFRGRKVDVAWMPPLPALRGLERGTLIPIAVPRRHGVASFQSVLFSKKGSRFREPTSLRGARVAWVERSSTAGFLIPRARLVALGVDPKTDFESEHFFHTHDAVARAVVEGKADLGATYLNSRRPTVAGWTGVCKDAAIQMIMTLGPVPHDVIAASVWIAPAEVEALQRVMIDDEGPAGKALLHLMDADRLIAPQQKHLEPLARLILGERAGLRAPTKERSPPKGRLGGRARGPTKHAGACGNDEAGGQ